MRVALLSGIHPPDIGGPATHSADLARELRQRGHQVEVVTLTDRRRMVRDPGLLRFPRAWPWPVRALAVAGWLLRHRRHYDVVYATGLASFAVAGAGLARRPVVLKVVGDPAWERGVRRRLTGDDFDRFQAGRDGPRRLRAMRALRDWSVRRADRVVVPGQSLGEVVSTWAGGRSVDVVPNGVRPPPEPVTELDDMGPFNGRDDVSGRLRVVFVGRLVAHKQVPTIVEAVARTEGVELEVVGEGPDRRALERAIVGLGVGDRVRLLGAQPHDGVLARLQAADALILASTYEGLPHVVLEAMVCGTPVVALAGRGVDETVADGHNGLVVQGGVGGLAAALAELRDDPGLRSRLRKGAADSGEHWRFDRCADRVEAVLREEVSGTGGVARPRVVYVGRTRLSLPLSADLDRKYRLHAEHFDQVVVATGSSGRKRLPGGWAVLLPDLRPGAVGSALFYAVAPVVGLALAAGRRSRAVVCQSPFEALGVLAGRQLLPPRWRPKVQVELHGDWRTAPRMYGSRRRRLLAPASDRAAAWALRRADRVRAVSGSLAALAKGAGFDGAVDRHPTFTDYHAFLVPPVTPVPDNQHAAFVGVLERYKAVDVLLDAWGEIACSRPGAELLIVGQGSRGEELRQRVAHDPALGRVRFVDPVSRAELVGLLDGCRCLLLPSRSEGLPRIVMEAMARGRPVVASRVGGMDELIDDGGSGLIVDPEDRDALVRATCRVLDDLALARSMGRAGRARIEALDPQGEYEAGMARLAAWVAAG